jgi:AraC-like DNA-binding protein
MALSSNQKVRLAAKGYFKHYSASFDDAIVHLTVNEAAIEVEGLVHENFYLVQLVLVGDELREDERGNARLLHPGDMIICRPGARFKSASSTNFVALSFQVDQAALARAAMKSAAPDPQSDLEFNRKYVFAANDGAALARFMTLCCTEIDDGNLTPGAGDLNRTYGQALKTLILQTFDYKPSVDLRIGSSSIIPYYVHRAEEFIRSNHVEDLSIAVIAATAGVSIRTLQAGFKNARNSTPMTFLRDVRLERVRRDLLIAGNKGWSVTQIATSHGFTQLGQFSKDYRTLFGELPSQTRLRGSMVRNAIGD